MNRRKNRFGGATIRLAALPVPPLAGLQRARELSGLDPASDQSRFTVAALIRERNRVVHALEDAAEVIDAFGP